MARDVKFSAVIFDMDGLMLDTERHHREIFDCSAIDCGIEFPDSIHEQLLGGNTADMKRILRDVINDDTQFERFMDRNRHHYAIRFAKPPPLKRGLLELLDFIESRQLPMLVATSTPRKRAIPRLETSGLLLQFASVSCGDEVLHGKPAPDLFFAAASTIGADPAQCIVLEDSEAGVVGAHAAGMTVCMVPDMKQPLPEIRILAIGVYESLAKVQRVFEDLL